MKLKTMIRAVGELGFRQTGWLAIYRIGLATGHYRRVMPVLAAADWEASFTPCLDLFNAPARQDFVAGFTPFMPANQKYGQEAIRQADEIVDGQYRFFGGDPAPLDLAAQYGQAHWIEAARGFSGDIKLAWEPARFGWAFTLGRAYLLSGDERYPQKFWSAWEQFQAANPPNQGVNWASAQEAALRLVALAFAGQVFQTSPHTTPARMMALTAWMVQHVRRIPPTIPYARAQGNNHLLSEAAGLYLAGHILAGHPLARQWKRDGWRWFNQAIQAQICADGEYVQHSVNYHRLMLHLALLVQRTAALEGQVFPPESAEKLAAATRWLLAQLDALSGKMPNLGHNDGSQLLPLTELAYGDYRPLAQAAALAFLQRPCLPAGLWDELSTWLGLQNPQQERLHLPLESPAVRRIGNSFEWGSLRARRYHTRPAHADQLQVELWHGGVNLLLDAGTYAYNQPAPWENGLAAAEIHNAPVLAGCEPMQRAGKFLWLDWDQADWLEAEPGSPAQIAARRFGFERLGVRQQRRLTWLSAGKWEIADLLEAGRPDLPSQRVWLTWLLPDGEWSFTGETLTLRAGSVSLKLSLACPSGQALNFSLARAGITVYGQEIGDERLGWFSPTYGQKAPALSLRVEARGALPMELVSLVEISAWQD